MNPLIIASLINAGTSLANSLFGGGGDSLGKINTQTKQQKGLQNNVIQQAMNMQGQGGGYNNALQFLQSLLDPNSQTQQNFAAPYLQNFNERILPGIAERFAGAGALSSSGFGQALGGAGAGLQAQLASLFSQNQQAGSSGLINQYNQLVNTGLGNPQFALQEKYQSPTFGQNMTNSFAQMAPYFNSYLSQQQSQAASPYSTQFPLTNYYDQNFRAGGVF